MLDLTYKDPCNGLGSSRLCGIPVVIVREADGSDPAGALRDPVQLEQGEVEVDDAVRVDAVVGVDADLAHGEGLGALVQVVAAEVDLRVWKRTAGVRLALL